MGLPGTIAAVGVCVVLSTQAFGCTCFSTPLCSRFESFDDGRAVFVGKVVDVWPTEAMLAKEARGGSRITGFRGLQRVRFVVNEVLAGPETTEVYTAATSCGFRFRVGQIYLVNAARDGNRYDVSACSRTGIVTSYQAVEDLKALRALTSGEPLAPRIYGRIDSDVWRPGIRVAVRSGEEEQALPVGADGRFAFDGLQAKTYVLRVEDGRGTGDRSIDLSRAGCFEAFPWFSDGWRIAGGPVWLEPSPEK